MTIAASISAAELTAQVTNRFVDTHFEAILVNLPGQSYNPATPGIDATFKAAEIPSSGGYQRQTLSYASGDVNSYADDGVALSTKAAVFVHDGSGNNMTFTHCMLIWGSGNIETLAVGVSSTNLVDGTYPNIPTTTDGSGIGATVDLTISGGAITAQVPNKPGYGYTTSDTLTLSETDLIAAGAITAGGGPTGLTISTVFNPSNAGSVLAVAQAANQVTLSGGNECAFYFNLKQFGYYSV
jgi:hypothetical protein